MSIRSQVEEFMLACKQPVLDRPQAPARDRVFLRLCLIVEELHELVEACGHYLEGEVVCYGGLDPDLPAVADALADLDYVIEGTRLEFGIDGEPIAEEVHMSNMSKIPGPGETMCMDENGKIMKPKGYRPPDIERCLYEQGWSGD